MENFTANAIFLLSRFDCLAMGIRFYISPQEEIFHERTSNTPMYRVLDFFHRHNGNTTYSVRRTLHISSLLFLYGLHWGQSLKLHIRFELNTFRADISHRLGASKIIHFIRARRNHSIYLFPDLLDTVIRWETMFAWSHTIESGSTNWKSSK